MMLVFSANVEPAGAVEQESETQVAEGLDRSSGQYTLFVGLQGDGELVVCREGSCEQDRVQATPQFVNGGADVLLGAAWVETQAPTEEVGYTVKARPKAQDARCSITLVTKVRSDTWRDLDCTALTRVLVRPLANTYVLGDHEWSER